MMYKVKKVAYEYEGELCCGYALYDVKKNTYLRHTGTAGFVIFEVDNKQGAVCAAMALNDSVAAVRWLYHPELHPKDKTPEYITKFLEQIEDQAGV